MRIKTFTNLLLLIPIFSVSAQNGYTFDLNIKTEPTEKITINETGIGLMVFGNIDTKNKITNTVKYKNIGINYPLETHGTQNYFSQFNSFENTFEFSHQLTENTKLNFEFKSTANFESNFGISDVTLLGGLEVSQSLNSNNKISVGIKRMTVFGKPEISPTFSFYHQISKNAFIELGFPNTEISYSNNIRNKFSFTNNFTGSSYNLDQPKALDDLNTVTKVGFSQISTALEYERNMDANWFVGFKGGYGFNKEYKLTDDSGTQEFNHAIQNGYIFNISIKYKH